MSSTLRIEKLLDALPSQLTGNTLYFIKAGNAVTLHITDKDGTIAYSAGGGTQVEEIEQFLLMGVAGD